MRTCFFRVLPVFVTVIMFVIITSVAYTSGSVMLATYVPQRFASYHCIGTISGLINAGASLGCLLSIYGYGLLADLYGWKGTIYTWIALSTFILLSLLSIIRRWTNFIQDRTNTC